MDSVSQGNTIRVANENVRVTLTSGDEQSRTSTLKDAQTSVLLTKNLSDPREIDLRVRTRIAFEAGKKTKLYILFNFILSITFVVVCCAFIIHLKFELDQVKKNAVELKQELLRLNSRAVHSELKLASIRSVDVDKTTYRSDTNDQTQSKVVQYAGKGLVSLTGDRGIIGPWILDKSSLGTNASNDFILENDDFTVRILNAGLYTIYSQIFYESILASTYFIILEKSDNSNEQTVATCSVGPYDHPTPVDSSCFTSAVHYLTSDDKIYIQQNQRDRKIDFSKGYSFFGLIKISV